jgi:hypothetical protein
LLFGLFSGRLSIGTYIQKEAQQEEIMGLILADSIYDALAAANKRLKGTRSR